MPPQFSDLRLFSRLMEKGLPGFQTISGGAGTDLMLLVLSSAASLGGIYLAYLFFLKKPSYGDGLAASAFGQTLHHFCLEGWGFDKAYNLLAVRPFVFMARINRNDFLDLIYQAIAEFSKNLHLLFGLTQTGNLRWYAMVVVLGAVVFIGMVILL